MCPLCGAPQRTVAWGQGREHYRMLPPSGRQRGHVLLCQEFQRVLAEGYLESFGPSLSHCTERNLTLERDLSPAVELGGKVWVL